MIQENFNNTENIEHIIMGLYPLLYTNLIRHMSLQKTFTIIKRNKLFYQKNVFCSLYVSLVYQKLMEKI